MAELGATGLIQYSGIIAEERLRQLSGDYARLTYQEMSQNDPVVGASLFAIDMLIRRTDWRVEPGTADRDGRMKADYLDSIRTDMSHSWTAHISEALTMLVYGYSPFEIVYKLRKGASAEPSLNSRYNDGLVGIRKFAIRSQDSLYKWQFDDAGGVQGLWQNPAPTYQQRFVPIEKMLLYRTAMRKGNPQGVSVLRTAFRPWYFKKKIEEIEAIGIERDMNGVPVAWVPPALLASDASSTDAALLTSLKKIVRNLKMDQQAGLVFPLAYDENNNKLYDLTLMTTGGRRQIDTTAVVARYNQLIAMTMLADVILLGHEKVGSFALASSKTTLFATALGAFLDEIEEVLNRHLVPRLYTLNGWLLENPAQFKHGDIESVDLTELGDYITKLSGAGMSLFPSGDGELERVLLEAASLPVPVEGEGKRPKAKTPENPPPDGTSADLKKYSPDQARDDQGQWTEEGGGSTGPSPVDNALVDQETEKLSSLRQRAEAMGSDTSLSTKERTTANARAKRIGRSERFLSRANSAMRAGRIDAARQHAADLWQTSKRFGTENDDDRAAFGAARRGYDALIPALRRS